MLHPFVRAMTAGQVGIKDPCHVNRQTRQAIVNRADGFYWANYNGMALSEYENQL